MTVWAPASRLLVSLLLLLHLVLPHSSEDPFCGLLLEVRRALCCCAVMMDEKH